MEMILRILKADRIEDYDLSQQRQPVVVGAFRASPEGGWHYSCGQKSGRLQAGDIILIDADRNIAALVLEKPMGPAAHIELQDEITIGRREGNHIVLQDRLISSRHCRIAGVAGHWYVEDLGSSNGTFLNDRMVTRAPLHAGDVLKLGRYRFRFGKRLCLENRDFGVCLSVPEAEVGPEELFNARPYPWFSPAPRILAPQAELHIEIESAPAIGDKPTMHLGGLALNPAMMAMSLGMQALHYGLGRRKYSKQEQKRAELYANYLADIENKLQEHAALQLKEAQLRYPLLEDCLARVNGPQPNLWERHPGDEDFLSLRLGTGTKPSRTVITIPPRQLRLQEDELDKVPAQLAQKYSTVDHMPIYASLLQDGNCALMGPRPLTVSTAHKMAVQLAALHSYDEVKLIVIFPEDEKVQWEWMRWLPHCMSDDRSQRYLICGRNGSRDMEALEQLVRERLDAQEQWTFGRSKGNLPHLVFLVADPVRLNHSVIGTALMKNQPELGVSGIFIGERMTDFPHSVRNVVELQGSCQSMHIRLHAGNQIHTVSADKENISVEACESFARKMAPVRLAHVRQGHAGLPNTVSLFDGLGIRSLEHLDLWDFWSQNRPESTLEVPIGIKSNGERFCFNIHEKGHGPHGIVAGGTGSGKSQMAQTWIASMALQFSPEEVNFVLVDFKGDSLLRPLQDLPHLAGTISNLDKNVARSFLAMESELERRQKLLSRFGCNDIISYIRKRRQDPQMPAMPYLILVVDEFAEFKSQFPEFSRALDHLYRGGRSLGLFVILMTQQPAGIVTEQMRANAAFCWCLSVKNESDSREILGNTDAYGIHNPGRAYVKSGDSYELIQSFFAGAEYHGSCKKANAAEGTVYAVDLAGRRTAFSSAKQDLSGKTQLNALVGHIRAHCLKWRIPDAQRLWQPELPEKLDLSSLDGRRSPWENPSDWNGCISEAQGPAAFLGMLDDPARQQQLPISHDFWKDGHLAVYGMPSSGKTTFLQTLMVSLCSRYTPEDVQLYVLDIGGTTLRSLEVLPHVGAAAGADEPEEIEKILALMQDELSARKKLFRREGTGSPAAYAETTGKALSTIIILADNLNLARQAAPDVPELMNNLVKLCREGAAYGIYLACSFSGTSDINYSLIQNIKTVYSLTLADKADYGPVVGRPSGAMPDGILGRGLIKAAPAPLLFQTAIAYSGLSDSKRTQKIRDVARQMDAAWNGQRPKGILTVPEELPYGSIGGAPFLLGVNAGSGEAACVSPAYTSLLVSDAADVKEDVLICLLRQAAALTDGQLYLYTRESEKYREWMAGQTIFAGPEPLDQAIEFLAQDLRRRQSRLKTEADAVFAPMLIFIDGLYDCISSCHGDTIARLEVFIRLGKKLGVFVLAADNSQLMGKCRYHGDILTETMRQGPMLLAGGTLAAHQVADTYAVQAKYPQPMDPNTAMLMLPDQQPARIRRMLGT